MGGRVRIAQLDPEGATDRQLIKFNAATNEYEVTDGLGETSAAELYEVDDTGHGVGLTAGVWTQWDAITVGEETGGTLITASAVSNKITIGTDGEGVYNINAFASVMVSNGSLTHFAVYLNGVRQAKLQSADEKSSNQRLDLSLSAPLTLVSGDELELYFKMDTGTPTITFYRVSFNVSRQGGGVGSGGGSANLSFPFEADQFLHPVNSDWAVNAEAEFGVDTNNAALFVLRFDSTTPEGGGFEIPIPTGVTNMTFKFKSRAETGPAGVRTVGLKIYNRGFPDNLAEEAWDAGVALSDIDIPTNEFWQNDEDTVTLASLGVTAGEITQFELVRVAPQGGTNLGADWALRRLDVVFS